MTSLELYVLIGLNVAQLNVNLKSVVNISAAAFVHSVELLKTSSNFYSIYWDTHSLCPYGVV